MHKLLNLRLLLERKEIIFLLGHVYFPFKFSWEKNIFNFGIKFKILLHIKNGLHKIQKLN